MTARRRNRTAQYCNGSCLRFIIRLAVCKWGQLLPFEEFASLFLEVKKIPKNKENIHAKQRHTWHVGVLRHKYMRVWSKPILKPLQDFFFFFRIVTLQILRHRSFSLMHCFKCHVWYGDSNGKMFSFWCLSKNFGLIDWNRQRES